jgi:hypothetical protein
MVEQLAEILASVRFFESDLRPADGAGAFAPAVAIAYVDVLLRGLAVVETGATSMPASPRSRQLDGTVITLRRHLYAARRHALDEKRAMHTAERATDAAPPPDPPSPPEPPAG